MRKKAFTLAELLIALAIVGIIAALTLPSLTKMKQEAGAGPQLSKVKASVEDAAGRIFMEDPSVKLSDYANFAGKISEYLVMTETKEAGKYRLKDGVVISFAAPSGSVSNASGAPFKDVLVDLNGSNMPNAEGVDKFKFTLSSQGLMVPQGCAAKLASNNWKASKDYDSATCSAYTLGETIPDTIGDDDGSYTPSGTKTCDGGVVIPANMNCEDIQSCQPVTCGCAQIFDPVNCQCIPDTSVNKNCTQGVWSDTECKCVTNACQVKTCPDDLHTFNSDPSICDCQLTHKRCANGSVVPLSATCYKDCNGVQIPEEQACPEVQACTSAQTTECSNAGGKLKDDCSCECPLGKQIINGKCQFKPVCNNETQYYDSRKNMCIDMPCCSASVGGPDQMCRPCEKYTCPDGTLIDPRTETCPMSYCCDCSRPEQAGIRCVEGNSTTPDCYAGCGVSRPGPGGGSGGGGGGGVQVERPQDETWVEVGDYSKCPTGTVHYRNGKAYCGGQEI